MRSRVHAVVLPEVGEFADDVRQIFRELGRGHALDTLAGECTPPLDMYETDEAIEIAMDLPGVDPTAIRIVVKGNAILVAGEKAPRRGRGDSSFHLVERGFGRFARTARLSTPCDAAHAHATLANGELRIRLPKIADRRGQTIPITVATT